MPARLRLLTYNIHKGFNAANRRFALEDIRSSIRQSQADLVCLQEVQGRHDGHRDRLSEWPSEPQFEYLADQVWSHHAYGKNAVYPAGHHGNAVLSSFPIRRWENLDVSTNPLESRGILHVEIAQPLHVFCLHLGLSQAGRDEQVEKLCARIEGYVPSQDPVLIAGDFNDWRERVSVVLERRLGVQEAFRTLTGHHARSFPSFLPWLRLDRVYGRGVRFLEARCYSGEPWKTLSDHLPLGVDLELES